MQQAPVRADEVDILHGTLRICRQKGKTTYSFNPTAESISEFGVPAKNSDEQEKKLAGLRETLSASEEARIAAEERLGLREQEWDEQKRKAQERGRRRQEQQVALDAEIQKLKDANDSLSIRLDQQTAALQSETEENQSIQSKLDEATTARDALQEQLGNAKQALAAEKKRHTETQQLLSDKKTIAAGLEEDCSFS